MIMSSRGSACPRCAQATVSIGEAVPWCAACEWNLDTFDRAGRAPEFGWAWIDRGTYRLAARLTRQQYAALVDRPLESSGLGLAGVATAVASILLTVGVVALAATGVWLLFAFAFPNLAVVAGVA
ncbi:hypothetical protein [Micromonospora coxensis]|uniref:hypothetical protein n=1 Tax=Micromonospora coxensis TaxID=356852 RepID=UPI00343B6D51